MADPDEILLTADEKMDSAIEAFRRELNGIRTGRAHPSLIETLSVDYYGAMTPLKQLGSINAPESRLLTIQVWDRGAVSAIQKAIQASDLGLNPAIDGQTMRLPIPALTEQRRKEYVKITKHMAEDGRVAVRNIRRDARKHMEAAEKAAEISADDLERAEKELEKITHDHVDKIDKALARKEEELLEV